MWIDAYTQKFITTFDESIKPAKFISYVTSQKKWKAIEVDEASSMSNVCNIIKVIVKIWDIFNDMRVKAATIDWLIDRVRERVRFES